MGRTSDARTRIVRAAARLFLSRSYDSVSVDELCVAADVRKGSFYHFFAAKSELAKAVIDFHYEAMLAKLDDVEGQSAAVRLRGLADAIAVTQNSFEERYGRVVGCPFGNLAAELSTVDDDFRVYLAAVFSRWEDRIADFCREASDAGALRPGVDPRRLAKAILAQVQGQILLSKVRNGRASDVSAAVRELVETNMHDDQSPLDEGET